MVDNVLIFHLDGGLDIEHYGMNSNLFLDGDYRGCVYYEPFYESFY